LLSKVVVLSYIHTSSVWGLLFPWLINWERNLLKIFPGLPLNYNPPVLHRWSTMPHQYFSTLALLAIYIPINSVWEHLLVHVTASNCYFCVYGIRLSGIMTGRKCYLTVVVFAFSWYLMILTLFIYSVVICNSLKGMCFQIICPFLNQMTCFF
jgi:hypothetical protein